MKVTGTHYVIYAWTMSVVCLSFILLRLQIRRRTRGGLRVSDWLVVAAWVAFIYQTATDTYTNAMGLHEGKINGNATEFGPEHGLATYEDTVMVLKMLYIQLALYYTEMYAIKGAMLLFYYELIPKSMPRLRLALHIVSGTTVVGWISSVLVKLFLCPVKSNYTPGPNFCSAINSKNSNYYEWAFHLFTDIIIYLLPMFLLRTLKMPRRQKYAVACTFGVGFVCLIWACLFQVSLMMEWPTVPSWFMAATEEWWCLVVVCCPTFRALVCKKDFRSAWRYVRGNGSNLSERDPESGNGTSSYELSTCRTGGRMSTVLGSRKERERTLRKGSEQWIGVSEMGNITETIEITRTVRTQSDGDSSTDKEDLPVVETVVVSDNRSGGTKQPVKSFYFV